MHWYEIFLITDIAILIIADTDNWSDTYVYYTFACIWQNYHFKNTVLVFGNIIRVCKINWPINRLIITDTDIEKNVNWFQIIKPIISASLRTTLPWFLYSNISCIACNGNYNGVINTDSVIS